MKLTFLGANHEVTGSCTLLETGGLHFLIDCGMEQGKDVYENQPLPVAPGEIDGVLLTHAHIDHSGHLPLLAKQGYRGKIYATRPTCRLCDIMLRDSAHIQESEAEWKNRKNARAGLPPVEPDYTVEDAETAVSLFVGVDYDKRVELAPGVEARFTDVGHLLGSASIELWVTEGEKTTKLVFSGDIGNLNQPILKDPTYLTEADYVIMESTYGDRSHPPRPDYIKELVDVLQRTFDRGGNVVIPSFAVGRTQELLYFMREIKEKNLVTGHGNFPVYIDSPLAIEATRIFRDTSENCFDADTRALLDAGIDPIAFPGLRVSITSDESRMINSDLTPKVILSASGMCDAGRIRHHLKHNLWRKECTILFVGYQAVGTAPWWRGSTGSSCSARRSRCRPRSPRWAVCRATPTAKACCSGSVPSTPSPGGCSSTMATTPWRTCLWTPCRALATRPARPTTGPSGRWAPTARSAWARSA